MIKIRQALISVSDKTGLTELVKGLEQYKIKMISTGGTYNYIKEAGVPVRYISEVTGFPEILDGRVKTLHPKVHGGILALRTEEHLQELAKSQIEPIDLVVVNLYPFAQTIAKPNVTWEEAIENIDIGGPTMIRSAAKNHKYVTVVVDPADYELLLQELATNNGAVSTDFALRLAGKAFQHTAAYDVMIQDYFKKQTDPAEDFPQKFLFALNKVQDLRYGENPHQKAAFYQEVATGGDTVVSLIQAEQLQGKELSFNNINDGNAALEAVLDFSEPAVVALKHTNPCGVGVGENLLAAYQKAYESDPVSIFGGIIAANREIDEKTAETMGKLFLEVIIAPGFSSGALAIFENKKNLRLLKLPIKPRSTRERLLDFKKVRGGLLVQEYDTLEPISLELEVVTEAKPTAEDLEELQFAWKIVKHVKSNAIVLTKNFGTVGIGAGQMNRVGAAKIAVEQAGAKAAGSYLASDAFFPMSDTVELAAQAGIRAIIQPGGSIRDKDSIDAANKAGIPMVFTHIRHFKH